jgi:hypothetical protein
MTPDKFGQRRWGAVMTCGSGNEAAVGGSVTEPEAGGVMPAGIGTLLGAAAGAVGGSGTVGAAGGITVELVAGRATEALPISSIEKRPLRTDTLRGRE